MRSPQSLLAIDPGVRAVGWACFWYDKLDRAGVSIVDRKASLGAAAHEHATEIVIRGGGYARLVVCELMAHRAKDPKSSANDLIRVATIGAAIAGRADVPIDFVSASEWKGTIPKGVHHARIVEVLSESERDVLACALRSTPKTNHKEALDAIGIGLHALGRTNRSGGPRR